MAEKLSHLVYVCPANMKEGEMRGFKIEGQWLLIVLYQGRYHALDAACAHSGYPLFKGTLDENGVITCGFHYARFDCGTGEVVSEPAICGNQKIFEATVKDEKVYWTKTVE
jgi:3-phenylpropionate/trans-cinnamate dioxygenase ferredoxin subunit